MMRKLGVVMDPIANIKIIKDTTFAMLLEAQRRDWEIYYLEQSDLFFKQDTVFGNMRLLKVRNDQNNWFDLSEPATKPLHDLNIVLMRKDPPFDMQYIYTTYLLELAEQAGVLVINKPQSLRDANEKFYTANFPQCCPPTVVSNDSDLLHQFLNEQQDIILKPLEGMGGKSVFRVTKKDPNINVIIENLTHDGKLYIMAQKFIPEITKGDKRILLIDGKPIPYALARIPPPGETRGNLAVGAKGIGVELSKRDRWICEQIGPVLKSKGLFFAGIDVIGDYLTEINVTSPTCIRELDTLFNLNISAELLDCLESYLA